MKKTLLFIFALIAWTFTLVIALHNVLSGNIPFWYDPARDMLSAWANLSKITLIGPPSGIPGIFYGPYWIWWLSLGELLSKDPKIVDLFMLTIPYVVGFPVVLFFFSKIVDKFTTILLWLLFFFSFQSYMIFIWNPNLAPLLFITIIYLLISRNYHTVSLKNSLQFFIAGVLTGLVLNIHISFSIGFALACSVFVFLVIVHETKKKVGEISKKILAFLVSFLLGIGIVFIPFFLFEMRHGFEQTKTAIHALAAGGEVVTLHGLTKPEIIGSFFARFASVLQASTIDAFLIFIASVVLLSYLLFKKKIQLTTEQIRLILLLILITTSVLGIYLLVKNPIWDYHFVGAEILWLLGIGLLCTKIKPIKYVLFIWIIILSMSQVQGFVNSFHVNLLATQSLVAEENIVRIIQHDIKSNRYTVYVYNPAIYSYDYSYLFRWMANKNFSYDPGMIQREGIVYLVLPKAKASIIQDFIHYRSPDGLYTTAQVWNTPNGITILKRVPKI